MRMRVEREFTRRAQISSKRRLPGLLLMFCLVFLAFGTTAAALEVSDIRGHWAEPQITRWMEQGWITGYGDGSFRPNHPITRAEFVALVNRSFGFHQAGDVPFHDIHEAHWAYTDVAVAVRSGYISGYQDGTFGAERKISRQEVAVIAAKLLHASADGAKEADFSDRGEIAEWAIDAVDLVADRGLLLGYPEERTFRPRQPVTRAEAVVILDRVLKARTIVYDTPGIYGPESGAEHVHHDVVIKAAGVTLRNMVIHGNLTFAEDIGEGDAFLNRVTVEGETFVYGGGENSIHVTDSILASITIDKKNGGIRIVVEGATTVTEVWIHTPASLDAGEALAAIGSVKLSEHLPQGSKVTLIGSFENVEVAGSEIRIEIPAGNVENFIAGDGAEGTDIYLGADAKVVSMILEAVAKVTGEGTIAKVTVSEKARADTVIETEVEEIEYPGETPAPPAPPTPIVPSPGGPTTIQLQSVSVNGRYVVGETLTATPAPAGATVLYQWQQSDEENGIYTNIAGAESGSYVIREADAGKWIRVQVVGTGNYTGTLTSEARQVEAKTPDVIKVEAIHVAPAALILTVGETGTMTATVEPADATNKKVVWTSGDEKVATVDEHGVVTAVAAGTAKITAAADEDRTITASADVRVISDKADVSAEDFGVVIDRSGVTGYSVGFQLVNATAADVAQIVVKLYKGAVELASVTSGKVLTNYPNNTALSAPFDVLGAFDYANDEGGNWIYSGWKGFTTDIPDKAEMVVTFKNGVTKTAVNENVTGNTQFFRDAVVITKTAYWGTPDHVFYYFDFNLGNELKIGDLTSLTARAYDGERLLSTISLKDESFEKFAGRTTLGGSFRNNPTADPIEEYWNLQAFDGTMPTDIVMEFMTKDGKFYRIGIRNVHWLDEGYTPVVNRSRNAAYKSIQEAIDAAAVGDNIIEIYPGDYGTNPIAIVQKEGVNITLKAVGRVVLKNPIKIDGDGRANGTESLTIKGFTFDFSESPTADIISAVKGELGSPKNNYAHNLLIEDVEFIGNPNADIVAVRTMTGAAFGLVIRNCQGRYLHSLGQLHVARGLIVENCTVTGGEGGINYYGDGVAEITHLTVVGTSYGVRAGQSSGSVNTNGTLKISSSNLTATYPVWLRVNAPAVVEITNTELTMLEGGEEIRNDAGDAVTINRS